jgi:hypothetical protein
MDVEVHLLIKTDTTGMCNPCWHSRSSTSNTTDATGGAGTAYPLGTP